MSYSWSDGAPEDGTEITVAANRRYNHDDPEGYEDFFQVYLSFTGEAAGQAGYDGPRTAEISEALHEMFQSLGFEDINVRYRTQSYSNMTKDE